jgi:hypothetical protein
MATSPAPRTTGYSLSRRRGSLVVAAAVVAAAGLGAAAPAFAKNGDGHSGGSKDVRSTVSCGTGSLRLKVKPDDTKKLEVEVEVDRNVVGEDWALTLSHNAKVRWTGTAKTAGASGSFAVNKLIDPSSTTGNGNPGGGTTPTSTPTPPTAPTEDNPNGGGADDTSTTTTGTGTGTGTGTSTTAPDDNGTDATPSGTGTGTGTTAPDDNGTDATPSGTGTGTGTTAPDDHGTDATPSGTGTTAPDDHGNDSTPGGGESHGHGHDGLVVSRSGAAPASAPVTTVAVSATHGALTCATKVELS